MLMTAADRKAENEERIRQEKEQQEKERVENLENGGYLWASPKGAVDGKDFYYMDQPENDPALLEDRGKIIYLTFDDGPSDYTSELLDFLDKYPEVKVTFFVVGQCRNHYDQIGRAAKAGHSIAVHSFTHDFKKI
jgi:peptidoglycan/xylan/chitin deacetylase (PgdA/CDA1 family)